MSEPHEHTVVDGVLQHVSPSQIQLFDPDTHGGCHRKWWFDKVQRVPRQPSTKGQELGTAGHARLENYLNTGEDTLSPFERAGLHFLPEPKLWLLVEHDAKGLTAAGVRVWQRIDAINYSGTYKDNEGVTHDDPGTVEVEDWKFAKNFNFAKTSLELRDAIQMLMYAKWVANRPWDIDGPLERIRLSHGVFKYEGTPGARKTTVTIGVDALAPKWQRIESVVERMKRTASLKTIDDVTPNFDACGAYGGCPYTANCPRTAKEKLSFLGGNSTMASLLNRIRKPEVAATAPVAHAVQQTLSASIAAEVVRLEAEERAAKGNVTISEHEHGRAAVEAVGGTDIPRGAGYMTTVAHARAVGVIPPDAPVSAPPASAQAIPPEQLVGMHPAIQKAAEAFVERKTVDGTTGEPSALSDGPVILPSVSTGQEPVADKPKRGRPKKVAEPVTTAERDAIGAALDAAAKVDVIVDEPHVKGRDEIERDLKARRDYEARAALEITGTRRPTWLPTAPSRPRWTTTGSDDWKRRIVEGPVFSVGLALFIDVVAVGITPVDLEPYIVAKCRALEAQFNAADVRCAPGDSPLGFGKWKGALAAVVRAEPPAPGAYTVTDVRGSEIREVVVEALRPLAAVYVRGR